MGKPYVTSELMGPSPPAESLLKYYTRGGNAEFEQWRIDEMLKDFFVVPAKDKDGETLIKDGKPVVTPFDPWETGSPNSDFWRGFPINDVLLFMTKPTLEKPDSDIIIIHLSTLPDGFHRPEGRRPRSDFWETCDGDYYCDSDDY